MKVFGFKELKSYVFSRIFVCFFKIQIVFSHIARLSIGTFPSCFLVCSCGCSAAPLFLAARNFLTENLLHNHTSP